MSLKHKPEIIETFEYISIGLIAKKPKTNVYSVTNNKSGDVLGVISWHGVWRQYTFFTVDRSIILSTGCMADISGFIKKIMEERKK